MTYNEIMTGITIAECKPELTAHIDKAENAIKRDECGYGSGEWEAIYKAAAEKVEEFAARVLH